MVQSESLQSRISSNPESFQRTEGRVARAIEDQTAKMPSDVFLWIAGGAMAASLMMHMSGRKDDALFIGQWAPAILIMGLYNKLVKVAGHDELS